MASIGEIFLLIIVVVGTICVTGILIAAYARYRVKKTPVTRSLIFMHVYYLLTMFAALVSSLFDLFEIDLLLNEADLVNFLATNPPFVLLHNLFLNLQVLFMPLIQYYFYVFARLVFFAGEEKQAKLVKLVNGMIATGFAIQVTVMSLFVYAIVGSSRGFPASYELLFLIVYLLPVIVTIITLVYYFLVTLPVFFSSVRLWKRVSADDPHKKDLLYLAILAFANIIIGVFNTLDTLLLEGGG